MKTKLLAATLIAFGSLAGERAQGGVVMLQADSNVASNSTFFNNVFVGSTVYGRFGTIDTWGLTNWDVNITSSASSYTSGAEITAASIIGINWLVVSGGPVLTPAELALVDAHIANGGNLYIGGEANNPYESHTTANAVLAYIASSMYLDNSALFGDADDDGTAVGVSSYTAGAPTWTGGYSSAIINGTPLYVSSTGRVLVAFETVPEPSSVLLLGFGAFAFAMRRRRI